MRANGDPYLQHCVETALLLAEIGANSTVVAAGLLHDTLDDSFVDYEYIYRIFGAGVADLVRGVSQPDNNRILFLFPSFLQFTVRSFSISFSFHFPDLESDQFHSFQF